MKRKIWKRFKLRSGFPQNVKDVKRGLFYNLKYKSIPGTEDRYRVNKLGWVFTNYSKRRLTPSVNSDGYFVVSIKQHGKRFTQSIHRLVAELYLTKVSDTLQVNHIDGNKQNNKVSNLEWCTASINIKHSYSLGLNKPAIGKKLPSNKSGFPGVAFHKASKKYEARLAGKYLGVFTTKEEAFNAYLVQAVERGFI